MVWIKRPWITIIPVVGIVYNYVRYRQSTPCSVYKLEILVDCQLSCIALLVLGLILKVVGV